MPSNNIFGLEDPPEVDQEAFEDEVSETEEPVEAAPAEETPEVTAEAEPEAPAPEPEAAVEEPAPPIEGEVSGEAPAPSNPELQAIEEALAADPSLAKFKHYEALREGYKNALLLHNRTAQRARDAERAAQEWQNAANQAMQMVQARTAPPQPAGELDVDLKRLADETGVDENTLRLAQAIAARQAQTQVQGVQQQMLEQQMTAQQQMAAQQLEQAISGFFAAHPEVTVGSPADTAVGHLVQQLDLDPSNPDALEVAYEISQDPDLELYVRANPHLVDTEEGMVHARNQVALNKRLTKAASTHTAAQSEAARQAALRGARVETGSGTPPTTTAGDADPWAQVLAVARKDRDANNAFGLPD